MGLPNVLPLNSPLATLDAAGGKGANLSRLHEAGFPVPPGFVITTDAYDDFTQTNGLARIVAGRLAGLEADDPASLDAASADIRRAFAGAPVPPDLAAEIAAAYWRPLERPAPSQFVLRPPPKTCPTSRSPGSRTPS